MESKYPEAIPVVNIISVRVTEALLNIYSGLDFMRETQCDKGHRLRVCLLRNSLKLLVYK